MIRREGEDPAPVHSLLPVAGLVTGTPVCFWRQVTGLEAHRGRTDIGYSSMLDNTDIHATPLLKTVLAGKHPPCTLTQLTPLPPLQGSLDLSSEEAYLVRLRVVWRRTQHLNRSWCWRWEVGMQLDSHTQARRARIYLCLSVIYTQNPHLCRILVIASPARHHGN